MQIKLVLIDADKPPKQIVLRGFPAVMGRSRKADVAINSRWISRFHCNLAQVADTVVLRDLSSANGTYLNETPIRTAEIRTGDHLAIGMHSFLVLVRSNQSELPSTVIYTPAR